MARTNYHHGALREALLTATLTLIETEGIGAVSLRRVARAAGVSPGAPYHHFPDRAALLTTLADEGFRRLAAAMAQARATAGDDPPAALESLLTAYIAFAGEHPAYFRLMFRPELTSPHKSEEGAEAGRAAFAVLADTVAECLAREVVRPADEQVLAITVWSLAHGYASLWLDGQLAHHTDDPTALAARVAALVTAATARTG